jgi:hypothetical protein
LLPTLVSPRLVITGLALAALVAAIYAAFATAGVTVNPFCPPVC